jgi:phosphoglycerate dehydrogenase-like enzyme
VTLTNAPGLHTIPLAESVMAAILDHAKHLKRRRIDQKDHSWSRLKNDELSGRTVLILGLGRIGTRVAQLCKAFGMRVLGTRRRSTPVENVDLVFPTSRLQHHLGEADYLVLALPHTPEMENMLGEDEFRTMKSSAYLINVGRGRVIDESAMIQALEAQWIAGAYLDAFPEEPLPQDHVLWDTESVFLVPHDSHSSPFIGDRLVGLFCDNLRRYVLGEPLQHICDPERGY